MCIFQVSSWGVETRWDCGSWNVPTGDNFLQWYCRLYCFILSEHTYAGETQMYFSFLGAFNFLTLFLCVSLLENSTKRANNNFRSNCFVLGSGLGELEPFWIHEPNFWVFPTVITYNLTCIWAISIGFRILMFRVPSSLASFQKLSVQNVTEDLDSCVPPLFET